MLRETLDCGFAACVPSPFEGELSPAERCAAIGRLAQAWERVDFSPYREGVWVLDLATIELNDAAQQLGVALA